MTLNSAFFKHIGIMLAGGVATAFLDYEVNSSSPFSKTTLEHAALAAVLVGVALLKQQVPAVVNAVDAPSPGTSVTPVPPSTPAPDVNKTILPALSVSNK